MTSATHLTASVCAHCRGAAGLVADDGLRACSQEHLVLARILGPQQDVRETLCSRPQPTPGGRPPRPLPGQPGGRRAAEPVKTERPSAVPCGQS